MTKKKNGICCICGKEGKLTFEHIPPHAAFNHSNLKMYDVIRYLRSNQTRYPSLQNGAGLWSLCSSCNNLTGTWYGNSYIEFVEQGIKYYQRNAKGILAVPYTIYPLRVFKQIVSCFASINGSDWCENNPAVRKFLLKPEERFFPPSIDIRMYLQSNGGCKFSGPTPIFDIFSSERFIGSEFAYPPFGFICDCGEGYSHNKSFNRLFSIREFLEYRYDDRVTLYLKIPRRPCNPILLDFREGVPSIEEHAKHLRKPQLNSKQ